MVTRNSFGFDQIAFDEMETNFSIIVIPAKAGIQCRASARHKTLMRRRRGAAGSRFSAG
ncbi:MAG: hypothetical protein WC612_05540 [Bdellovibrionales bacterium]|jgi:hypothetical protein